MSRLFKVRRHIITSVSTLTIQIDISFEIYSSRTRCLLTHTGKVKWRINSKLVGSFYSIGSVVCRVCKKRLHCSCAVPLSAEAVCSLILASKVNLTTEIGLGTEETVIC